MGVVSGIVMSYQFGTNWSVFSDRAGPIIGPLMAYEVLTAFFLEAGFLGVMLFGMNKVGKGLHFTATLMVAVGTFISAFWILSVNSWMQTPTGWAMNEAGQFVPAGSWLDIIFNPSFPYRLVHTVIAAYLTTALVVGGVGAWHLLKGRATAEVRTMFSMAMWMAALVAPVQIFVGDQHGLNTYEHQPVKIMAIEGHFQSHPDGAPLYPVRPPRRRRRRPCASAIAIPQLGSLLLEHDTNAPMRGLDTVPIEDQPPVAIVFWSFRIMVGLGFLMLGSGPVEPARPRCAASSTTGAGCTVSPWLMGPAGFVAVIAGWVTTEVGRQPWVIYGLLRTAGRGLADRRAGRDRLADRLRHRLFHRLRGRHLVHPAADARSPRARASRGPAEAPIRTAGITPAPAVERRGPDPEEGR